MKNLNHIITKRQFALSEALSAYYDKRIDVDICVGESKNETPNQEKIRKEDEILKKVKEDLEVDPGIRDIKDIFPGASFDSDSVKLKNEKYLGEEMKGGIGQLMKQAQQMQEKNAKSTRRASKYNCSW